MSESERKGLDGEVVMNEAGYALSAARSLKRIADALEKLAAREPRSHFEQIFGGR